MKPIATILALAFLGVTGGCQMLGERAECQENITALKASVEETGFFLQALRPELRDGFVALEACQDRSGPCEAGDWLLRAEQLRLQNNVVRSRLEVASNAYDAARCEGAVVNDKLSPFRDAGIDAPKPDSWRGYISALDQTGKQIDRLIEGFTVYAR
ncbi:hypothetical protein [Henriciella aquimarina]|uniref:hypothetical protein n=1 Tax=Henriciella aquimarina TaxID=545261 RepID=UPI000A0614B6|nr:hypothetical protein [Henriciella aquimarina]